MLPSLDTMNFAQKILRITAVLVLSCLGLAIAIEVFPPESHFGKTVERWKKNAMVLTGLHQHWDMFTTVPYNHAYEMKLDVRGRQQSSSMDPILPAFSSAAADFRYHTLFARLTGDSYQNYLDPYLQNVHQRLLDKGPSDYSHFRLVTRFDKLRGLDEIRHDRAISYPSKKNYTRRSAGR